MYDGLYCSANMWKDLIPALSETAWPVSHLAHTCVVTCRTFMGSEGR